MRGGVFLSCGKFLGLGFDAFEHAAKNEVVEGKHGIPVEKSEQAFRLKFRVLFQAAAIVAAALDAKFENGDTG